MSKYRKQWSDDHGADGLRDKFAVYKSEDGLKVLEQTIYADRDRVGGPKEEDEFVFVLRPSSDKAACEALWAYVRYVGGRSPLLAQQIRNRLLQIDDDQKESDDDSS